MSENRKNNWLVKENIVQQIAVGTVMLRQKIKEKKDMDGAGMQAEIELFYSS